MSSYTHYIFGYGSLAHTGQLRTFLHRAEWHPGDWFFCRLHGYRRAWNVAMDNRVLRPGYKYYVDRATGERPAAYVTFMNVYPMAGASIGGVLFGVTPTELALLDRREANYQRISLGAGRS
ncbi:MAG: gamma-glutamylcyclotransferase [Chloroflexaceae bacterium]|nr:gamma-glutamylcyclotransferase [Chloroflexaceae bacterium]